MEKLLDALRETLAALGLDESAIEAALKEAVTKAEETEEKPKEGDPAPTPKEQDDVTPTPETDVVEGEGETPSGDPNPVEDATVEGEPVPTPEDVVPPAEPTPAPAPAFDPTKLLETIDGLTGQLSELKKANEGLVARINSLEDSLKSAGVIDGETPKVEVGDPLPAAAPQNPTDDVLGSVLSEINGKRRY